jgi:hypothetical protein
VEGRVDPWRQPAAAMTALAAPGERLITIPAGVPELTLGWGAMEWAIQYLRIPNGPDAGEPWDFTLSQVRFFLWYYAITPDMRWMFSAAVRRLVKGAGKSPIAGVHAITELLGPVRPWYLDDDAPGGVVGKAVSMPLVQIAATSESQTANTMRMIRAMTAKKSKVTREYRLDPGKTVIYTPDDGQLEVITSSAAAAEGALVTFAVRDEALALDTPIPCREGWTTVGKVGSGDRIFGSDGPVTVISVTSARHGRPCYRLTFDDGTSLVTDEGHLWSSRINSSAALPKVRTTKQMADDGRKFMVPKMKAFDGPEIDIPIDPYVLGLWLGDGASRWAGMSAGEKDLPFMLLQLRSRGVPAAHVVRSGSTGSALTISMQGNSSSARYTKDGSSVRGALVKLRVLGDKHIPAKLLRASLSQRLDLLRGLMDTDGYIDGKTGIAVLVSARERLAKESAELIRSLGYRVSIIPRTDYRWKNKPVIWKISFRADTALNPFLMPRKSLKVKNPSARRWRAIRTIEPAGTVPVKCIEVDSPDHLFAAGEGWILTHNTEHWRPANGGDKLAQTIDRNLAKTSSRAVDTCNAWEPGIGSVAEEVFDTWVAQEEGRTRSENRILYDAYVASPDTDLADDESLEQGITEAYHDCHWVDQKTIKGSILDLRTPVDVGRRFYLNQPVASLKSWVTPQQWAAISNRDKVMADVFEGDDIALFFDGSRTADATAIMACHIDSGDVFTIDVWEPLAGTAHSEPEPVPVNEVDAAVDRAFERWNPVAFFGDVREWESFVRIEWPKRYAERLKLWAVPGGKEPQPIAWDMRTHVYDFTMACELVHGEIEAGEFIHDGDSRVARHIANCRNYPNRWGTSVSKETRSSARKIDAGVCVIGARMARRLYLAGLIEKNKKDERSGKVHSFE